MWLNGGVIRRAVAADLAQAQSGPYQDGLSRASGISGLDMINILGDMTQSLQHLLGALSLGAVLWRYGSAVPLLPLCGGVATWLRDQRFAADLYEWDQEHTRPRRRRDALAGLLTDRAAAKEVRLYQAGSDWVARWRRSWVELQEGRKAKERRRFAARAGLDALGALLYGGALVALLARIVHGGMTIGAYVAGAASLVEVEGMWNWAANHATWLADAMRHMRGDLFAFLDAHPEAPPPPPAAVPVAGTDLELEDVGFTYPGAPAPSLAGVTLRIPAGQRVGIVGPNGAGKTTLARIVLREPQPLLHGAHPRPLSRHAGAATPHGASRMQDQPVGQGVPHHGVSRGQAGSEFLRRIGEHVGGEARPGGRPAGARSRLRRSGKYCLTRRFWNPTQTRVEAQAPSYWGTPRAGRFM